MDDYVLKQLEAICSTKEEHNVKANRGMDSYSIALMPRPSYSFNFESQYLNLSQDFATANDLYLGLVDAVTEMGVDDPESAVEGYIIHLAPKE